MFNVFYLVLFSQHFWHRKQTIIVTQYNQTRMVQTVLKNISGEMFGQGQFWFLSYDECILRRFWWQLLCQHLIIEHW